MADVRDKLKLVRNSTRVTMCEPQLTAVLVALQVNIFFALGIIVFLWVQHACAGRPTN